MRNSTELARGDSGSEHAYQEVTLRLAQARVTIDRQLRDVLREVTEVAAAALRVNRVSVWFFLDERRSIRCDYLHEPQRGDEYEGAILHASDFPVYFRVLESCRVVRFVDRDGDPMSEELRHSYLAPLGITAMLDAPIYQGGEVVGIVCHEYTGSPRQWTDRECEFAASVGDIVARLYAEAARLRVESQLGIDQARLSEVQQFAEVGRLAAGVAHDFNNVLTAVFAYVDLVKAEARDEKLNRLATDLGVILGRARDLTQTLMTLGRTNNHRPRVVSPADVLTSSLALLRGAAGPRVHIEVRAAESVSRILIDPLQLERAIVNLVVNASDAMPVGGVVTVDVRDETIGQTADRQSTFVVIEVIDSGQGMDDATRERMFDAFFTTKGTKGKGLGLAIVNQVVTLAGGFIQVDSAAGRGTRVRLYLPRIAANESGPANGALQQRS
jgi:two-component system, cell cycle sensor histidine kinase and response regulator CckA